MQNDQFSISAQIGHMSFDHLSSAMQLYEKARTDDLLDVSSHAWPACFSAGNKLIILRREELKQCIYTVILFQAMMEKIPYFVTGMGPGLKKTASMRFRPSWLDMLNQIKDPKTKLAATNAFNYYDNHFYKAFRTPIIHGRAVGDIKKIDLMRVPGVFKGMKQGWEAYDYLLTEAFAPEQIHTPSWTVMCGMHSISQKLNPNEYPDLENMRKQFSSKHLNGARSVSAEKNN